MLVRTLLMALSLLCAGCAVPVRHADAPPVTMHRFEFEDGGSALYFVLDKGMDQSISRVDSTRAPQTLMFVIPGSDCISMAPFLPQYFDGLHGRSGPIRIFILHKRFVTAHADGRDCGPGFVANDHPSRWLADQAEFISTQLNMANANGQTPARVLALGISEGAEVAPVLARRLTRITHVALVANGGMNPAEAFALQARRHGFEAQAAAVQTRCNAAKLDTQVAGRSCRYWKEMLETDHAGALLALSIPVLVAMGDADRLVPPESASFLAERFAESGKDNLSLKIYSGADHGFTRLGVSLLPYLWEDVDNWLMD